MVKRTFITWIIFFLINFCTFMLLSRIGLYTPITLKQGIITAFAFSSFYLIFLFCQTRKHPNLAMLIFIVVGILFVFILRKSGQITTKQAFEIDNVFWISLFIQTCQSMVAWYQGEKYREEKICKQEQKDNGKLEYEEISPDGSIIRKGIIKN